VFNRKIPAATVVAPVYVLAPVRINVPAPVFRKPPLPANGPFTVNVLVLAT
jgi:hypothetical protein